MGQVVVDTSVWVDCFRGIQNTWTQLVADLLTWTNRIAITPTILQEALQGIRNDDQFVRVRANLLACTMLRLGSVEAAVGAADLYRSLRKKGVIIRKPNDRLIAYYALYHDVLLLHNDVDFRQITQHTQLRVVSV